jgi:hypothetical protein
MRAHETRIPGTHVPLAQRTFLCAQDATVSVRQIDPTLWHVCASGNTERLHALGALPVPGTVVHIGPIQHLYACTSAQQAHVLALFVFECLSVHAQVLCAQEQLEAALPLIAVQATERALPTLTRRL